MLEIIYFIFKIITCFLVFLGICYLVIVFRLVGLFFQQFLGKNREFVFDGVLLFLVIFVFAEFFQKSDKILVVVVDSQSEILDDGFGHLIVIDADGILVRQAQVVGKTTRQLLHKGVDGADAEIAIVVHDAGQ